jgi:pyruvate formate lyase activating enzyme
MNAFPDHDPVRDQAHPARWWHALDDGRLQCDLCPRECKLHEGQRGLCFVRARQNDAMVLTTYGRSSGFCIDPIEKKPLNHFYPGSSVLSFGTAGCNLACKFCQNWDISKSREMDRLQDAASPARIAEAARDAGCHSVAFTYNDPVIFAEYAMDTADVCHELGVQAVAVTAGYIHAEPRREFYAKMDAANIDLKAFTNRFYVQQTGSRLTPVLDTLAYVRHETDCWLEITTLLIPGLNDSADEIDAMTRWISDHLGTEVPLHFTAFHPAYKLNDTGRTPPSTLQQARRIALANGLKHVYLGNVHDREGGITACATCGEPLIERDWHRILHYRLDGDGACPHCRSPLAGRFDSHAEDFGPRRIPVHLA